MSKMIKMSGLLTTGKPELGKVVPNPYIKSFIPEYATNAIESTKLGEIAMRLLAEEREKEAKKDDLKVDPTVTAVQEKNPPKVEDQTKEVDLPKPKKIAVSKAPKSKDTEPKYTQLSNYIPVEYKRGECEAPKLTGKEVDEDEAAEWEEGEEIVDKKIEKMHMVVDEAMKDFIKRKREPYWEKHHKAGDVWKTPAGSHKPWAAANQDGSVRYFDDESGAKEHSKSRKKINEAGTYSVTKSGDKWKVVNPSGVPLSTEYNDESSARAAAGKFRMHRGSDYGDKVATPSKKENIREKWNTDTKIKKLDKYGKEQQSLDQLKSKQSTLRAKKDRTDDESKELKRVNFAIRARTGWGKAEGVKEDTSTQNKNTTQKQDKSNRTPRSGDAMIMPRSAVTTAGKNKVTRAQKTTTPTSKYATRYYSNEAENPILLHQLIADADAGEEAKRRGLTHIGWGRYADKSGKITHVSKKGKLTPVQPSRSNVGSSRPAKVGNEVCSHKNVYPDLVDWCWRCEDCGEDVANLDPKTGHAIFNKMTGFKNEFVKPQQGKSKMFSTGTREEDFWKECSDGLRKKMVKGKKGKTSGRKKS